MKTRNIMRTALVIFFALIIAIPVSAAKKEKKKKAKKEIEWVMPELTGNEVFDDFLKQCDSLYLRMQNFEKEVPFYEVRKIKDITTGDSCYAVVDSLGNIRSSSKAFEQYLSASLTATTLVADFAIITMSTASATLELPALGLKALSYGKYIKTGGELAIQCPVKLKEMIERFNVQRKAIRAYKQNFDEETGKIKDPNINPDTLTDLNLGENAVLEKTTEEIAAGLIDAGLGNEDAGDIDWDA